MKAAVQSQRNPIASVNAAGANGVDAHPGGGFAPEPAEAAGFHETGYGWAVLGLVWVACGCYMAAHLREGWIPYDAGGLSHMADRVLQGQVPFADFGDAYTGGLTLLNALALRLFGATFLSIRVMMFLFFVGWVPAVYLIARRFTSRRIAAGVTLLCVAWSVPNYSEAMPSWYNLFFATWGILALFRYIERRQRRWLWAAGSCAGLSFLAKISGLYFVAAALLFIVFYEQSTLAHAAAGPLGLRASGVARVNPHPALLYRLFVTAGLATFLGALAALISSRPTPNEFFQFVFPTACLVGFLAWETWDQPSGRGSATRLRHLLAAGSQFLAGSLLPVAPFVGWLAAHRALRAWFVGVFVTPAMRTGWAAYDAIPSVALVGLVPALLVLLAAFDRNRSVRRLARYGTPLALLALLLGAWRSTAAYSFVGFSLPLAVPLIAVAAPLALRRSVELPEPRRQQVFLLAAAAVLCELVQFPFSAAIYFEYAAPLVVLALVALLALPGPGRTGEPVALGSLLVFYLAFALWLHTPGFTLGINVPAHRPFALESLSLERAGGIRGFAGLVSEYDRLIPLVREHARGPYTYATPDMPEVYFLSGLRNPTPDVYDALAPDFFNPAGRTERIMAALRDHAVGVVVLGPPDPVMSGALSPGLRSALHSEFPHSERVGEFAVRWK